MSTLKVAAITDTSGGNTATINSMTPTADSLQGFRNRIINGDMEIDQRNAGAAVTINSAAVTYSVDRWAGYGQGSAGVFTLQQSTTVPTGFINSLKVTVTTADASIAASDFYTLQQRIEGFNVADLGWGTANAKTVTLSFWVRSSLTGTFSGALVGAAFARSYPFTYSISAANTWEQKTVTVAGDTSGSWVTNNGTGLVVYFDLGSGSDYEGTVNAWNGALDVRVASSVRVISTLSADWYVTGVQLEVGSVATPFERRDYGRELAMCQRYYYKQKATNAGSYFGAGLVYSTTKAVIITQFGVQMRTAPSALEQTGTASDYRVLNSSGSGVACSIAPIFGATSNDSASTELTVSSGLTAGNATMGVANTSFNGYLAWSAEL
jgi:hypothetical protein